MKYSIQFNEASKASNIWIQENVDANNEISFWLSNPHSANVPGLNHYSSGIVLG